MLDLFSGPYALAAKLGAITLVVASLFGAILWYGNSREQDGIDKTDAKWVEASLLIEKQIDESSKVADESEVTRVENYNEQVAKQKQELDKADREDGSYFDAIFDTSDSVSDDKGS